MIDVEKRKEKVTVVYATQTTVYLNNDKLIEGRDLYLPSVIRALGFQVDQININCHDMPKIHSRRSDYSSYEKLSDLVHDMNELKKRDRKERIQSLYAELTRLEKEDRLCDGQ